MEDNASKIISNALSVGKINLYNNIENIIKEVEKALFINKDLILEANKIDQKNNNGFIMDFNILNNIFKNLEKETIIYGNVTLSEKDEEKKIIYGKQIMDYGNVLVINDGNPYVIIEMALRNILAGNTIIFANKGYMYGTNNLIINIIKNVLEKFEVSKYLIQLHVTEEFDSILSNYANINLVVCIGNRKLQNIILNKSKIKTITSGYENFDLYIEDDSHIDLLKRIVDTGLNIQLYINNDLKLDYKDAILVSDIDEAIGQINYNGSKYSASIFTKSANSTSRFMREVNSKIITVNASPTIERIIDIKQSDLIIEKTIIYPLSFKFDGSRIDIN